MPDPVPFPGAYHRKRQIDGRHIWKTPEPSDFMVWEVCPHLRAAERHDDYRCHQCPIWEHDPSVVAYTEDGDDRVKRGCRMKAEEVCRVFMAVQAQEAE